jgi:hypothetical protein
MREGSSSEFAPLLSFTLPENIRIASMNVQIFSGTRMKKPTMKKTVPIPRMPRASCVNAVPGEPT